MITIGVKAKMRSYIRTSIEVPPIDNLGAGNELRITRHRGDYGTDRIVIMYRQYVVADFAIPGAEVATVQIEIDLHENWDNPEPVKKAEPAEHVELEHVSRYNWIVEPEQGPAMYSVKACMTDHPRGTACTWQEAPGFTFTTVKPPDGVYVCKYLDDQRSGYIVNRRRDDKWSN